jgi:hypothetical protein
MGSSMSSGLFPGTDELLMHPSPRQVASLPAESVVPLMLKQLDEQAGLASADFETTLGLGQLARLMNVQDMESQLEAWLQDKDEAKGNDTAALFLAGFWPDNPKPSPVLIERLLAFLAQHAGSLQVVETLLLALSAALGAHDQELRERNRGNLRPLLPLYPLLQKTSQTLLQYGLTIPEHELPKVRPDSSDFRAHFCEAGSSAYACIEHASSQCAAVRVLSLTEDAGTLRITYEISILALNDRFAQELIARTVVLGLCQDRFRGLNDQIEYSNPSRRQSTTVAYSAAVGQNATLRAST